MARKKAAFCGHSTNLAVIIRHVGCHLKLSDAAKSAQDAAVLVLVY